MPDNWVPIIDAISNGFVKVLAAMKDLALVIVSVYVTYATSMNSGKLEAVAAKTDAVVAKADNAAKATEQVKSDLAESSKERDDRLHKIEKGVDANIQQWKAYTTKEPEDMARAAKALQQHDTP